MTNWIHKIKMKFIDEELPNSMQLLKHVAKHHTDIQSKTKDIQLEDEALEKDPLEELEAELSSLKRELS